MAAWDEAANDTLAATLDTFGGPVQYDPAGGGSFPLASGGVFSDRYKEVDPDTGASITSTRPNLVVHKADWPDGWTRQDVVTLESGDTYHPIDVQSEGNPHALRVFLHQTTP